MYDIIFVFSKFFLKKIQLFLNVTDYQRIK